ncbi:MAG: hypothetical protein AAF702_43160 [Chloroflexota bacterium]
MIVCKRKFDGRVKSEWEGERIHLADLYLSASPPPVEGWIAVLHHPARHRKFVKGVIAYADPIFIHYLNTVEPLTVLVQYTFEGEFVEAKCDAALPAILDGEVIEFIDLDLDVIVQADFSTHVRDELTFAQNREIMNYPEEVVAQAARGIRLAKTLIELRSFPFDVLDLFKVNLLNNEKK